MGGRGWGPSTQEYAVKIPPLLSLLVWNSWKILPRSHAPKHMDPRVETYFPISQIISLRGCPITVLVLVLRKSISRNPITHSPRIRSEKFTRCPFAVQRGAHWGAAPHAAPLPVHSHWQAAGCLREKAAQHIPQCQDLNCTAPCPGESWGPVHPTELLLLWIVHRLLPVFCGHQPVTPSFAKLEEDVFGHNYHVETHL